MQLDQLTHWRLQGEPDVFTETRDGEEWLVIDSDKAYRAGFSQVVHFDKLIDQATVGLLASFFTGSALSMRIGIDPTGNTRPDAATIEWSGWYGTDNGWAGKPPWKLAHTAFGFQTKTVTVFLEAYARWPVKNTSRWRDVCLEVEYAGVAPGPTPDPEPEPDPDLGIPGQIAQALAEIRETLEQIGGLLDQWDKAQEWVDEYNENKHNDHY